MLMYHLCIKVLAVIDCFKVCTILVNLVLKGKATQWLKARIIQIDAANESTRIAETRLAESREELSKMQQRLLAAEEAASRDARKMDTLARDVKAEQQHASATLERLERAHLRIQQLESQVCLPPLSHLLFSLLSLLSLS